MSLGVAVIAHLLLHFTIGITSAGIVFVYLSALLIASWCGYGPGGLILFLAVFVLPYFYRSNFSPGRVDKVTLFVLILVWLGVSRVAADRRRHEQVLRDVAAQLDERVRTNTDMVLHRLAELESLYGQLPVGVCFLDRELKFVRINDKFAALNGAPPDAHFRRPLRELVSSKLADVMEPLLRQVLESGQPITEHEFKSPSASSNGTMLDWALSCSTVTTSDGRKVGLQITLQDITERKRSEEKLAEAQARNLQSEEQFQTLANAIPTLCWMADENGWIFWYNHRWYEYTGTTPEQMKGWGWQSVHDPSWLPDVLERWGDSLRTGQLFEMVFPLRGADGVFRPFLTRVVPVRNSENKVVRWFGTNTDIASHEQAKDRIRELNKDLERRVREFETLLEVMPVGVGVSVDPAGNNIRVNAAFAAMLGITAGENGSLTGPESGRLPFKVLRAGNEISGDELPLQLALRNGVDVSNMELDIVRDDGSRLTELAFAKPLFDEHDRVRGGIGVFLDISERKQAENALRESEERFRIMADSAPVLIWVSDDQSRRTWFNKPWLDFTGLPMELQLGQRWAAVIHPDDVDEVLSRSRTAFDARQPFTMEYRMKRSDGSWRWIIDQGVPRLHPDGTFAGYIGSCLDVTERWAAEVELRDSEQRLRLAQGAAGFGVWDWDLATNTIKWTVEIYRFLGLEPGSVAPSPELWLRHVHPEDRELFEKAIRTAPEADGLFATEFRLLCADGSVRWILSRGKVFRSGASEPYRMIGVNLDLTERKQAEADLQRSNEDLRKLNAELEEFAYVASHDLQEPLRMVSIYSELLLRRSQTPVESDTNLYATYVRGGVKRMQRLIGDLLNYSRITHELDGEAPPVIDLNLCMDDAMQVLEADLSQSGATIEREPLPMVRGERTQVGQVFQNLLSNALKYKRREVAPIVRVTAEHRGGEWVISVSDNGVGFDERYRDRIFGLFKRLHNNYDVPGTGLGLAISRRIVERYGGRIWAESKIGVGSIFHFALPEATGTEAARRPGWSCLKT